VLIVGVAVAGDVDLVVAIEEPMAGLVIDGQLAAGRATTWGRVAELDRPAEAALGDRAGVAVVG
jgi:hypothetical protein